MKRLASLSLAGACRTLPGQIAKPDSHRSLALDIRRELIETSGLDVRH